METVVSAAATSLQNSLRANVLYLTAVTVLLITSLRPISAGICWEAVSSNGRCHGMRRAWTTKEDCCRSGQPSMAWTPYDANSGRLFYWRITGGAPDCVPCKRTCENVKCPEGKTCRMRNGRPRCVCTPDCHQYRRRHNQVCGDDGKEYRSHCALLRYNCRFSRHVNVDYFSKCQRSCSAVECPSDKHCVTDQNGMPHCVECRPCTQRSSSTRSGPWCGTDGNTYESVCALQHASCTRGNSVGKAYAGECREGATCDSITCPERKQCLVDLVTGRPRCMTCNSSCPAQSRNMKICGTDNVTYQSWCAMRRTSCLRGVYVETKHSGPCIGRPVTELSSGGEVVEND